VKGIAKNIAAPVRTALIAALVAVVLDGITTYIGIARFHCQEARMVAWSVARAWGRSPRS
jgi:hypothetical protein